jgi:hypothetical protein
MGGVGVMPSDDTVTSIKQIGEVEFVAYLGGA